MPAHNKGYTSGGFKSNLQARGSLARAVTVDSESATKTRPLHTLNVMCKQKQHSPQMKKRCSDKNGFTFLGEIYRVRLLTFQQNILKIAVQTSCKPNYPTLNQTFQ